MAETSLPLLAHGEFIVGNCVEIGDVDRATLNDRSAQDMSPSNLLLPPEIMRQLRPPRCHCSLNVAIDPEDEDVGRVTHLGGAPRDRIENGLQVHRRSGDHPQHLSGGGLLPAENSGLGSGLPKLRLELRDPRVRIVRHHVHPGHPALLRDGARIARGGAGDM